MRSTIRPFAQWNLILAHLQHSKTLEKHENKDKVFELNVYCSYFHTILHLFQEFTKFVIDLELC